MTEPRVYSTDDYQKHKRPAGWGSLCPHDLPELPQALLDKGAEVVGASLATTSFLNKP